LDPGIFQAGSCEQQDLWEDSPGVLFGNRNEFYNIYYNIYLFIYLNEYYIYGQNKNILYTGCLFKESFGVIAR
jgi:hypothetical protein